MALRIETLSYTDDRSTYEEPDGSLVEFITRNRKSIDVLTRVDTDKGEPVYDPANCTISEIKQRTDADDLDDTILLLIEAEKDGKHRKGALNYYNDCLENG